MAMNSSNPYESPLTHEPAPLAHDGGWSKLLFSFQGRAPRRHFWAISILGAMAFLLSLNVIQIVLGKESGIGALLALGLYIPFVWMNLAITVKRWHDRGESGWWMFVALVPIVGWFWAFVQTGCLRGTYGPNEYGPDPT